MTKFLTALIFFIIIGWFTQTAAVNASEITNEPVPSQTNIGKYIYEDKDYLTQKQVNKINRINQKLFHQIGSQNIAIVIIDRIPIKHDSMATNQVDEKTQRSDYFYDLVQKFSTEDLNRTYRDSSIIGEKIWAGRNILFYSVKDKQIYFQASSQSRRYLTDFKFWQLKWNLFGLKSNDQKTQLDSLLTLFERVADKEMEVARDPDGYRTSWSLAGIKNHLMNAAEITRVVSIVLVIIFCLTAIFKMLGGEKLIRIKKSKKNGNTRFD
jgi:hypothetical protein